MTTPAQSAMALAIDALHQAQLVINLTRLDTPEVNHAGREAIDAMNYLAEAITRAAQELAEDDAIDAFNRDMSNASNDADRTAATATLAQRLGNRTRAERLRADWMMQNRSRKP